MVLLIAGHMFTDGICTCGDTWNSLRSAARKARMFNETLMGKKGYAHTGMMNGGEWDSVVKQLDAEGAAITGGKEMTRHVMLDLETLGTTAGSTIISLGAVVFGDKGLGETFYDVISRQTCRSAGMREEPETVAWWAKQSDDARLTLTESTDAGASVGATMIHFSLWLRTLGSPIDKVMVWGNGASFDNVLLSTAARMCGFDPLWKYTNDRCYRTLRALRPNIIMQRSGTHHNALDDARTQAEHAVRILNDIGAVW